MKRNTMVKWAKAILVSRRQASPGDFIFDGGEVNKVAQVEVTKVTKVKSITREYNESQLIGWLCTLSDISVDT